MALAQSQLTRQNWGFLSEKEQDLIGSTTVLLAGCGLGSNVAVLAARTGFQHFIAADGDLVEASNLNRQAFRVEHLGQNKAEATSRLIREVNPDAEVEVVPRFLQAEDADAIVERSGLVVNMVDPGPALDSLLESARRQGKITLFPLNVAFGGLLLAFGPESPSMEELVGSDNGSGLFVRIVQRLAPSLPQYIWQFAWVAARVQQDGVAPPHLGIAASITASLVVENMIKVGIGTTPALVPEVIGLDTREPSVLTWPGLPAVSTA